MIRRYYVQAVDEVSGEPVCVGSIEAFTIADAIVEGHRQAAMSAGHLNVRVTHVAEQETTAAEMTVRNLIAESLEGGNLPERAAA